MPWRGEEPTLSLEGSFGTHQLSIFWRFSMMRFTVAFAALALIASPTLAADPKADAAVKAFKAVAANAGKLKTFCEMSKVAEAAGEKEDAVTEGKIDAYLKQLGPDFEAAWDVAEELDENSADGKIVHAALDELEDKCS
jgi:hypothetical protein